MPPDEQTTVREESADPGPTVAGPGGVVTPQTLASTVMGPIETIPPATVASTVIGHDSGSSDPNAMWAPETVVARDAPVTTQFHRSFPGFQLLERVGEGGMGEVWKAHQLKINRIVAVKLLKGRLIGDKEVIRFLSEAEAIGAVHHPHVVQVFDYGGSDDGPFLVMEYLPGGSLADRLRRHGRMDPLDAAKLVRQLAQAVQAAHDLQIVHRDLKPGNVLFCPMGEPKVTDFGLAKRGAGSDLTTTNAIMGTPAYMPPEQARGETKFVGPQADIYSLGVILYECLTGTRPFQDGDLMSLLRQVAEAMPERPRRRVPEVPLDLELIALKCLEKKPADRYQTAAKLAEELRRFLDGEPISVRTRGVVERTVNWARRKPTLAAVYALTLLVTVLGGLGGVAVWQWIKAVAASTEANRLREKVERSEYGARIQIAHQNWRDNNVSSTLSLLRTTRKGFRGWEYGYVDRLCHSELVTIRGSKEFLSAAYNPAGDRILTTNNDGKLQFWDPRDGREILGVETRSRNSLSAAFSPDGKHVLLVDAAQSYLLDAETGRQLHEMDGRIQTVTSSTFSPDSLRFVNASLHGTLKVWDVASGLLLPETGSERLGNGSSINTVAYSPDGTHLLVAGDAGLVYQVEIATLAQEEPKQADLVGHDGAVLMADYSGDGKLIVSAGADHTARIWDAQAQAERHRLEGHIGAIHAARFDPAGKWVATAGEDRSARLWDAGTGTLLRSFRGHTQPIYTLAFSPDGSHLVTASADRTVRVWGTRSTGEFMELEGGPKPVHAAGFNPDGSLVVTADGNGLVKIIDATTGTPIRSLSGDFRVARAFAISPDGRRIAVAGDEEVVRIWDLKGGEDPVLLLKGTYGEAYDVDFSPDSSAVVTAHFDESAHVWDAATGAERFRLGGHRDKVRAAAFSPNGKRIVTAGDDGTTRLWDAATGAQQGQLRPHAGPVLAVAFSPDGSRLATASEDRTVRVSDPATGNPLFALEVVEPVQSVAFSPDGSRLATGGDDGKVSLWDAASGALVLTLNHHYQPVRSVAFSHDGSRLVSAGDDGKVKIWDSRRPGRSRPANREEPDGVGPDDEAPR